MVNLNVIISIFFWLPIVVVIFYNLVWDLRFYQRNNFSLKHIYHSIRWDFETSHRSQYKLVAKLLLFVAIITFLFNPLTIWPAFAVLGMYIVWTSEAFIAIEKIYLKKLPQLDNNWRTTLIAVLCVGFLGLLPIVFTLSVVQSPSNLSPIITSIGELLPTETVTGIQTPGIYLYLIFSTLLALTYDLITPLIVLIMVIITKPVAWINRKLKNIKATNKLLLYPNLIVIGITGSTGKTTTKNILEHTLAKKFKVVSTPHSQVNEDALLNTIIDRVHPDTQILIVEMNAYRTGQIAKLCKIAPPHISVLTGVDESHIGMFGSLEKTLAVKSEILHNTKPNGTVVLNADDENIRDLITKYDLKEILVYSKGDLRETLINNHLTLNYYHASKIHHEDKHLQMNIESGIGNFELNLQNSPKFIVTPALLSLAVANELGMQSNEIIEAIESYPHPMNYIETSLGDDNTYLWVDNRPQNFRSFKQGMEYILENDDNDTRIILITNGIKQLGKYKSDVYKELSEVIHSNVDLLVTTDSHLSSTAKRNNYRTQINLLNNVEDIIYAARQEIQPNTVIMILGDLDLRIIEELSA